MLALTSPRTPPPSGVRIFTIVADDPPGPILRHRAKDLFRNAALDGRILVSTQVVQEFYVAGLRKLGMPRDILIEAIEALLELPLVNVNSSHILAAIRNEERYRISFWDA